MQTISLVEWTRRNSNSPSGKLCVNSGQNSECPRKLYLSFVTVIGLMFP